MFITQNSKTLKITSVKKSFITWAPDVIIATCWQCSLSSGSSCGRICKNDVSSIELQAFGLTGIELSFFELSFFELSFFGLSFFEMSFFELSSRALQIGCSIKSHPLDKAISWTEVQVQTIPLFIHSENLITSILKVRLALVRLGFLWLVLGSVRLGQFRLGQVRPHSNFRSLTLSHSFSHFYYHLLPISLVYIHAFFLI